LVGPSSILLAMMASGMNGQSFTSRLFTNRKDEKKASFKSLERISFEKNQSQIY
jgi:16S rRNA (cytidine1402-2'-O)-methyltransferase